MAHHDSQAHFDGDDVRIAEQLAAQLALALKLQEQASDHANALAVFESHQQALHNLLTYDLYRRALAVRTGGDRQSANTEVQRRADRRSASPHQEHAADSFNLLAMQARASSSAQVRDALLDSADRLHVLAKVHELLYASANSTQRVFMPQLLQSLGARLGNRSAVTHPHVALDIECDRMELPAQNAVALALLTNEAVTNAYKHAFTNESPGTITVALHRTRENALLLRIEDTGSGFASPDGGEGMGLTLIRSFATQLCGTLAVRRTRRRHGHAGRADDRRLGFVGAPLGDR